MGNSIQGAKVSLYKNPGDSIVLISDSTGIVFYKDLEAELYYWFAQKGCKTNRNSQTTLNRLLIKGAVLYGHSVLTETGALKVTNISAERYNVKSSHFDTTIVTRDSPYITYPRIGFLSIHSEKNGLPGAGKDTTVQIRCGDTTFLILPY